MKHEMFFPLSLFLYVSHCFYYLIHYISHATSCAASSFRSTFFSCASLPFHPAYQNKCNTQFLSVVHIRCLCVCVDMFFLSAFSLGDFSVRLKLLATDTHRKTISPQEIDFNNSITTNNNSKHDKIVGR